MPELGFYFNWYDVALLAPLLAIVAYQMRQRFSRGLLDAGAAGAALYLASCWAPAAAPALRLSLDACANAAYTFLALFAFLLLGLLLASRFVEQLMFQLSLDAFDPLVGFVAGAAAALIVGHAVTSGLMVYYGAYPPEYLTHSPVATEILDFRVLRHVAEPLQQMVSTT